MFALCEAWCCSCALASPAVQGTVRRWVESEKMEVVMHEMSQLGSPSESRRPICSTHGGDACFWAEERVRDMGVLLFKILTAVFQPYFRHRRTLWKLVRDSASPV